MRKLFSRSVGAALAIAASVASSGALAQGSKFLGGDFSINGQFRLETAFNFGRPSAANQFGLRSNGLAINRIAGNPATGFTTDLGSSDIQDLVDGINDASDALGLGRPVTTPSVTGTAPRGVSNSTGSADTITRYIPYRRPLLNYHALRFESSFSVRWKGGWSFQGRLRSLFDPGEFGYEDFDYADYNDINNGFQSGTEDPALRQYSQNGPDHLGYRVDGEKNPLWFERSGKHYSVDFPAFFFQWTNGNITARLGNQSVAWGQLLFFRIMDTANGLDLRRHLFLDRAIEEFADERMSAPGLRITWQMTDRIVADAFAMQFIPTILTNANTAYNPVDSRFIARDNYFDGGYNEELNYGVRFKAEYGTWNWQAMYTSRLNQFGTISWANSEINKALPNSNALGLAFNQYCEAALGSPTGEGCGPQLAQTPFEVAPLGLLSAEEWFDRASYTKLDGIEGLNRAIRDFQPVTGQLLTSEVSTAADADRELDAFFIAAEGLHGHVQRDYYREDIFGIGGGLVTQAELGSFFDQIVINLEATYTPNRTITLPSLGNDPPEREDMQVGLVVEKYHRFSQSLPATFMVFQYLWQKNTDLAGLGLNGYGSENYISPDNPDVDLTPGVPRSQTPQITPGLDSANYFVLAALAPGQAYVFEYSVAALFDVQGGVFVQPGIQWKPRGNVTVNLFYNYADAGLWGDNKNDNLLSLFDHVSELSIRLGYQF